ncbi:MULTISPECIES: TAXI family TRAP transporter solute-binding subunit [Nocardiaceae]|uniref:TAXI family TRAP transporter solute-binding subunit n=1 Tax=Nocardiaceae TaxID=85025 RepID=UPI00055C8B18|nr:MULTISPECIES: TAXI family TRAP transporter solute-binding subunit [Rhodococcus]OZF05473.1 hypothetical protein CH301_03535 [Rhodococcus sp. 15-1189-1-1a]OZF20256.1 hypothetical protein CH299_04080 [Rhodococcus sp. 14-2686-1-2]OZF56373.1 hypothetical protein CH293_04115 [Rhodococcus sp. 14-2470-1b]
MSGRIDRRTLLAGVSAVSLAALLPACSSRPVPSVDSMLLATGPAGATYRETGTALAERWNDALARDVVDIVETDAAVDNAALLTAGSVDLGFVNADVAKPYASDFSALFRVFDSVLHLAVMADGPVRTLQDLPGMRVAIGLPGSGTRFTALRLLDSAGLAVTPLSYGQDDAARALLSGELDAVFSLTAMPTPALDSLVKNASASGRAVEFLDLAVETEAVRSAFPGEYVGVVISRTVYPDIASSRTLAVPTFVLVRNEFPRDLARFLTASTFENVRALSVNRPEADQINPRTGAATTPIPLHPGAADWFREHKP